MLNIIFFIVTRPTIIFFVVAAGLVLYMKRNALGPMPKETPSGNKPVNGPLLSFDNTVTPQEALAAIKDAGLTAVQLWVDDDLTDRIAPRGWVHVTTAHQANAIIDAGVVVELSLDNDLGDDEKWGQGKDVVDFICEKQIVDERNLWPVDGVMLHTANGAARDSMTKTIISYGERLGRVHQGMTSGGKRKFTFDFS